MVNYSIAEAIIEVFNASGVDFVFFNPGIDNVPVLETISKYRADGRKSPRGILCLDEFSIAIDPVTTMKIEDVLVELKKEMTIVMVTNLVQQARRIADTTAFFNNSKLIEVNDTDALFTKPDNEMTNAYVNGVIG